MKPRGKSDDGITLTLQSKYAIRSLGSREETIETRGIFRGVVSVGTVDALAIELDGAHHKDLAGKIRVIPSHMVLAIDILEQAAKEEESREEANIHYT